MLIARHRTIHRPVCMIHMHALAQRKLNQLLRSVQHCLLGGGAPGAEEVRSGVLSPLGLGAMCAHVPPLQPSSRRSYPKTRLKDEAQVHAVMAMPGHPMDFISSAGLSEQVSPLYGPSLWELRPVQRQLPC